VFNRRIGRKIDTSSPFDMADAAIERYVLDDIHNGLASADGGNVVLDFVDPDGSDAQAIAMSKRYLYGEVVDQLFAQEDLSKTLGDAARNLWPLVDHLGTVRDLAKQDGTVAVHYKYDSYGNVTSGDTSKTRYLFTSREFDTATNLQYNRARWYDAAVGRWVSEDPLRFEAGDGNHNRYVGNGATNTTDPSGLEEPAFYRLRIESQPGDWFYPGRNPGEGFWEFCLRSITLTMSNPSFQGGIAMGGPGSNFGGALNQSLRLKCPNGACIDGIERHGVGPGFQRHAHGWTGKRRPQGVGLDRKVAQLVMLDY
jgi:RHS repeat-associated protein